MTKVSTYILYLIYLSCSYIKSNLINNLSFIVEYLAFYSRVYSFPNLVFNNRSFPFQTTISVLLLRYLLKAIL